MDLQPLRRRYSAYDWAPVTIGASTASVFRLEGSSSLYVKVAAAAGSLDLSGEADRLAWLARSGIPVPETVELVAAPDLSWLVTQALVGVSAAETWTPDQRPVVVDGVADLLSALHGLPVDDCPFDRSLAVAVPAARTAATAGAVDLDDLDAERAGWTAEQLLSELDATMPSGEDLVVCHGDFCLPNVVVDPETLRVSGVVDVGRAGRADRHQDLALMTRSLQSPLNADFEPGLARRFLLRYTGADEVDPELLAFYRLLDEFF